MWHTRQEGGDAGVAVRASAGKELVVPRKPTEKFSKSRPGTKRPTVKRLPLKRARHVGGDGAEMIAAVTAGDASGDAPGQVYPGRKPIGANGCPTTQAHKRSGKKGVSSANARGKPLGQIGTFHGQVFRSYVGAASSTCKQQTPLEQALPQPHHVGPPSRPVPLSTVHLPNEQKICEYPTSNHIPATQTESPELPSCPRQLFDSSLQDLVSAEINSSTSTSATTSITFSLPTPDQEESLKRDVPNSPSIDLRPSRKLERLNHCKVENLFESHENSGKPGSPVTSTDDSSAFDLYALLGDREGNTVGTEGGCMPSINGCRLDGPHGDVLSSPAQLQSLQPLSCLDGFELDEITFGGLGF